MPTPGSRFFWKNSWRRIFVRSRWMRQLPHYPSWRYLTLNGLSFFRVFVWYYIKKHIFPRGFNLRHSFISFPLQLPQIMGNIPLRSLGTKYYANQLSSLVWTFELFSIMLPTCIFFPLTFGHFTSCIFFVLLFANCNLIKKIVISNPNPLSPINHTVGQKIYWTKKNNYFLLIFSFLFNTLVLH